MRIISLPNLITDTESTQFSLKNCSVVIDGQNYLHNVYQNSHIPFIFGTEANKYANELREYLRMYQQANVKCYIVLKGGDSNIEQKMQKFEHSKFEFDTNEVFIAPVLIKDVYKQVLEELHIDYAMCLMESKDECVALAQKLACPVISYDIEFCFKCTPYIPYNNTMIFKSETNSIECRRFQLQEFLQRNSLTEEKAAVFVTLSDITVFPDKYFDPLLKTWRVYNTKPLFRLKNLIKWLSENSLDDAKRYINHALQSEADKNKFWGNVKELLINMRNSQPGCVTEYLLDSGLTVEQGDPQWFKKGVALKIIAPVYVNLCHWRVIEGSWVTEDKSYESLLLSIDIVKYAYNLLTNFRGDTFKLYREAGSYEDIDSNSLKVTRPNYGCVSSVFENGWEAIRQFRLFEHFLHSNGIDTEILKKLSVDSTVLLITLAYYAKQKRLKEVDVTLTYAVLLSYVMLNYESDQEGIRRPQRHDNINKADYRAARLATAKYFEDNQDENKRIFDGRTVKRFIEFEYCLQHMNYLNILCGSPYQPTIYHRTYNGGFVYKMCYDIPEMNPDVFIHQMLQSAPSVLRYIGDLMHSYRQLLGMI